LYHSQAWETAIRAAHERGGTYAAIAANLNPITGNRSTLE
jgi:hypothetical protein